jgi:hypothetical protein
MSTPPAKEEAAPVAAAKPNTNDDIIVVRGYAGRLSNRITVRSEQVAFRDPATGQERKLPAMIVEGKAIPGTNHIAYDVAKLVARFRIGQMGCTDPWTKADIVRSLREHFAKKQVPESKIETKTSFLASDTKLKEIAPDASKKARALVAKVLVDAGVKIEDEKDLEAEIARVLATKPSK